MTLASPSPSLGKLLRQWRQRRRLSQLDLALETEISARHLSFLETGRAAPSRQMVLRLAEQLALPLREQNTLLVAAGYAPVFRERTLDDPALEQALQAVNTLLRGHEPYPALVVDRCWNLVSANRALENLMTGISAALLEPPLNVLRLSLHPEGLAPRIVNLAQWRGHLLERLGREIQLNADPALLELERELRSYPSPTSRFEHPSNPSSVAVVLPLVLSSPDGPLSFISTSTVFGTATEVTLSELTLETFFPADAETAQALRRS